MIATVILPPVILTSVDQVPLYPDYFPKWLDIPDVASVYGKISRILYLDYTAADLMFGHNSIQFGTRFKITFHCRDDSLRVRVISALDILLCYSITPTLIKDHKLWLSMDTIIDMLLPGCLTYNLAKYAAQSDCWLHVIYDSFTYDD